MHDDGPGFPAELRAGRVRAFRPRRHLPDARTVGGGAGLGLALVEAIAHAHGGSVSLDCSPGDTTISVHL